MMPDKAAIGPDGGVRDVLCIRAAEKWEVGISCKHNHEALKHSRITKDYDFAQRWLGGQYHVSDSFINRTTELENQLKKYKGQRWNEMIDKDDRIYVPLLDAFKDEFLHQSKIVDDFAARLLKYFIGSKDFYKLIMNARDNVVSVMAFI